MVEVGVAIGKIGNSSLRYELAILNKDQTQAAAHGICACVCRSTNQKSTAFHNICEVLHAYMLMDINQTHFSRL